MSAPDPLRERLLKILRLAEQGVGGERANAEAMLEKMLRKHRLTRADLESDNDARSWLWLRTASPAEGKLCVQVFEKIIGVDRTVYESAEKKGGARVMRGAEVTASERAAVLVAWDVFRPAFENAIDDLFIAFVVKHRIFDPHRDEEDSREVSREEAHRLAQMVQGLGHVASPFKRIGGR